MGDVSCSKCMSALLDAGYSVAVPWGDSQRYDLIVDTKRGLKKVQCKTAWLAQEGKVLAFRTSSINYLEGRAFERPYTEDEIDLFMVYSPDLNKLYAVPILEVLSTNKGGGATSLRLVPTANGQKRGVRFAKDYEFTGTM